MHKLMDFLCNEMSDLEKKAEKGKMTMTDIDYLDKLAHAAKNLEKVMEYCDGEEDQYSNYSRRSYYYDGPHRNEEQRLVRPDGTYNYDMYSNRGRGSGAKRDSMGRYSRTGGFKNELYRLMDSAPDEHTRKEFEKFMEKIEQM